MKNTIFYVIGVIGAAIAVWLFQVKIGVDYESMWLLIIVVIGIVSMMHMDSDSYVGVGGLMTATAILLIVFAIKFIWSPVFMTEDFVNLVQVDDKNTTKEKKNTITLNTNPELVLNVSKEMAGVKAMEIVGQMVNGKLLSSQFQLELNSATIQLVNGEMVWVIPLDYSGFFKWFHLSSIPAFIIVSATDVKGVARLIKDKEIKLSRNGYFGGSIERFVWTKSGFKETKTHFELDDNMNPYYISVVVKPEIGFNADGISSVIVTNAQTKISKELSLEEVLEEYPWIDRIWPKDIVNNRISWYLKYNGNSWLSANFVGENVSVPTSYKGKELWLVADIVDGEKVIHFSTGATSANNADNSMTKYLEVEAASSSSKPILHILDMYGVADENMAIERINNNLRGAKEMLHAVIPQPYFVDGLLYWTASVVNDSNVFEKKAYIRGQNVSYNRIKVQNPKVGEDGKNIETQDDLIREIQTHSDAIKELTDRLLSM